MKIKNIAQLAVTLLFITACSTHTAHSKESVAPQTENQKNATADICADIKKKYADKSLNILVPKDAYSSGKVFFIDIDNDGKEEELKYFNTRTHAYISEMVDGKRMALPGMSDGYVTEHYNGNTFINYNGKTLQLHAANGPYELQELRERTPTERNASVEAFRYDLPRQRYDAKVLCRYYAY